MAHAQALLSLTSLAQGRRTHPGSAQALLWLQAGAEATRGSAARAQAFLELLAGAGGWSCAYASAVPRTLRLSVQAYAVSQHPDLPWWESGFAQAAPPPEEANLPASHLDVSGLQVAKAPGSVIFAVGR